MKIMICGSMTFAKDMLHHKALLEGMGHEVLLPCDAEIHAGDGDLIDDLERDAHHLRENDILRKCFTRVAESDAVLILNKEKGGVPGYIGTSTLMELGLAYHLDKKLYLLHPVPHSSKARWAHEIGVMNPVVLHGNVRNIQ